MHSIPTNVDLIVDGKRFPVNNIYLSACSPVFAAMFQLDMKERNASEVEIKDVASAEHFGDFLLAFLPEQTSLPNRTFFDNKLNKSFFRSNFQQKIFRTSSNWLIAFKLLPFGQIVSVH